MKQRVHPSPTAISGATLLAAAFACSPAQAHFVATAANTYISVANGALQYGYNIDALGHVVPGSGFIVGGGCDLCSTATGGGSTDGTGLLTAASEHTRLSFQSGLATANAFASADLGSATLAVVVDGSYLNVLGTGGQDGGRGTAVTYANDTLHFSMPSASADTVTPIGVSLSIAGNVSWAGPGGHNGALINADLYFGTATFATTVSSNSNQPPTLGPPDAGNWLSWSLASYTPGLITFQGMYALQGQASDVIVQSHLHGLCEGGDSCSYTSRLSLQLPDGASYSSDSGVFLSAPVPEPGRGALMAIGVAGLLALRRRR